MQTYTSVVVNIDNVPVTFTNVEYWPAVATEWTGDHFQPPEPPIVDFESVMIGGVDVTDLMSSLRGIEKMREWLGDYLENQA